MEQKRKNTLFVISCWLPLFEACRYRSQSSEIFYHYGDADTGARHFCLTHKEDKNRSVLWSHFLASPNSSVIVHSEKFSEELNIKVLSTKKSISIKYYSIYRFQVFIYLANYYWKLIIFNLKIIKHMNQKNPILL